MPWHSQLKAESHPAPCAQLMFSHPDDPESVKTARAVEVAQIRRWVEQKAAQAQQRRAVHLGMRPDAWQ